MSVLHLRRAWEVCRVVEVITSLHVMKSFCALNIPTSLYSTSSCPVTSVCWRVHILRTYLILALVMGDGYQ